MTTYLLTIDAMEAIGVAGSIKISTMLCDLDGVEVPQAEDGDGNPIVRRSRLVSDELGHAELHLPANADVQPVNTGWLVKVGNKEFIIVKENFDQTLMEAIALPAGPLDPFLGLDGLSDVVITGLSNGDGILYDAITGLWKNAPLSVIAGVTSVDGDPGPAVDLSGSYDPLGAALAAITTAEAFATAADAMHVGLADPHTQYQLESEKGAVNGYAPLDGSGLVADSYIPAGIARDAEMTTAISAAISVLTTGAPGTLDTLDELAAALGDDPNFATTLTNLIATKVAKSLYDANTILTANSDDTPIALTVGEQTIVGRITGGNIAALTPTQVKTLLVIASGDVSGLGTAATKNVGTATGTVAAGDDSRFRHIETLVLVRNDVVVTAGDGKGAVDWPIPSALNGWTLTGVGLAADTPSSANLPTVQVRRVRAGSPTDLLTTKVSIDVGGVDSSAATTPPVIDATAGVATLNTGDKLYGDCDIAGTGTKGLILRLTASPP